MLMLHLGSFFLFILLHLLNSCYNLATTKQTFSYRTFASLCMLCMCVCVFVGHISVYVFSPYDLYLPLFHDQIFPQAV